MHYIRLTVRGRVQGVGFRWFVRREAERIGVAGYVKNEPDGSVTAEAEGSEEQIREFEACCSRGPAFARVTGIEKQTARVRAGQFDGFDIR